MHRRAVAQHAATILTFCVHNMLPWISPSGFVSIQTCVMHSAQVLKFQIAKKKILPAVTVADFFLSILIFRLSESICTLQVK